MLVELVPITSWQIDGETVADFIFLGSKQVTTLDYNLSTERITEVEIICI